MDEHTFFTCSQICRNSDGSLDLYSRIFSSINLISASICSLSPEPDPVVTMLASLSLRTATFPFRGSVRLIAGPPIFCWSPKIAVLTSRLAWGKACRSAGGARADTGSATLLCSGDLACATVRASSASAIALRSWYS